MAENLWALREQKKISVATLASRAGLAIGLIIEYEIGQRSIDPRHLGRLARALYVEESELKLQSDPRPSAVVAERRPDREPLRAGPPPGRLPAPILTRGRTEYPPRQRADPLPPGPARPSQITHLQGMLPRVGRTQLQLEAEIGKPLVQLDRVAASELLRKLQAAISENTTSSPNRRRAYLPESVDEFEARYLTAAQAGADRLHFCLFDGGKVDGVLIGFGPYTLTLRLADGAELTLNKLAVVSYRKGSPAVAGGGATG